MSRDTVTISLPKAMARQVDQLCKAEQRTRSELFREAFRTYVKDRAWLAQFEKRVAELSVYAPNRRELEAIAKGREEMRQGKTVTLDELFKAVEGIRGQPGRKGNHARPARRRGAAQGRPQTNGE
jgi:metal-responsive CopG/Arc/MetJ family transcriptional regulator